MIYSLSKPYLKGGNIEGCNETLQPYVFKHFIFININY